MTRKEKMALQAAALSAMYCAPRAAALNEGADVAGGGLRCGGERDASRGPATTDVEHTRELAIRRPRAGD